MIYFIFDLDDTIVIHPTVNRDMYNIKSDPCLQNLFDNLYYKSYIFTNGPIDHAHLILDKLKLYSFKKIFARDTIPYMKPNIKSFLFVQNNILYNDYNTDVSNTFIFFDDVLENLKTAKKLGGGNVWINPKFNQKNYYDFIDLSFPNIYDALYKINNYL